jgi:hypothetical protein
MHHRRRGLNATLLAAGELADGPVQHVGQLESDAELGGTLNRLAAAEPARSAEHEQILSRGHRGVQGELLWGPAKRRARRAWLGRDVDSADSERPGVERDKSGDGTGERRLAGAVLADEPDDLTGADGKGKPPRARTARIDRSVILRASLDLADERGLAPVTMGAVAVSEASGRFATRAVEVEADFNYLQNLVFDFIEQAPTRDRNASRGRSGKQRG